MNGAAVIMSALNEEYVEPTVKTLLEQSGNLLREIIVVDDCSDVPLDFNYPKTRIIRNQERQGLIRSRDIGIKAATSDVVFSLDPHCKVSENWLSPALQRLSDKPKSIVLPMTRGLKAAEWKEDGQAGCKTSWRWNLDFYWRHDNGTDLSPSMAGHCFGCTRDWYHDSGGFDLAMDKWGGENIEFSLRTWLCGGTVEVLRDCWVAHMFKSKWNYEMDGNSLQKNKARIAEVWFDNYLPQFYKAINRQRGAIQYGDIVDRLELKNRLQERPMDWFINNLQKELHGVFDLRGLYFGKNVAVLGASPAYGVISPEVLKQFDVIIGVNYVALDHQCDYVIFHDRKPAFKVLESGKYRPEQLLVPMQLKDGKHRHEADPTIGWRLFELGAQDKDKSLKTKEPPFFHHASTSHTAAHVAAFMGAKTVTMIACDGKVRAGQTHANLPEYSKGKYWPGDQETQNYLNRMSRGYDMLQAAFEEWKVPLLRYGFL